MLIALSVFLIEGFALAVFPAQFKQMLVELEPRWLQALGLAETILAAALIAGIVLG